MKDDDKQVLDSSLESFANALRENDSKQIKLMQKFFLLCLLLILVGIGLLIYFLDYLTQFNPEKIDLLLEQNLRNQRQSQNYILPPIALTSIAESDQKLKWTPYKNGWTFHNSKGKKVVYDHNYCLVSKKELNQLKIQHGILWDGTKWDFPDKFKDLFHQKSSD